MRWRTLSESKREMDHTHTYMFVMDRVAPLEVMGIFRPTPPLRCVLSPNHSSTP
jgi:hypothetical protein